MLYHSTMSGTPPQPLSIFSPRRHAHRRFRNGCFVPDFPDRLSAVYCTAARRCAAVLSCRLVPAGQPLPASRDDPERLDGILTHRLEAQDIHCLRRQSFYLGPHGTAHLDMPSAIPPRTSNHQERQEVDTSGLRYAKPQRLSARVSLKEERLTEIQRGTKACCSTHGKEINNCVAVCRHGEQEHIGELARKTPEIVAPLARGRQRLRASFPAHRNGFLVRLLALRAATW